jgi:hypothetical protein
MADQTVAPGQMRLYDEVRPALPDGLYRLTASTTLSRPDFAVGSVDGYFVLDGPRFALPATEVVAVHPPVNAQGAFEEVLPHVVLGRRTLPWERELDPGQVIPAPTPNPQPLSATGVPWLGLLLFVDDPARREVTVLPGPVPLSTVITDPQIRGRMGLGSTDPAVQAIEVDAPLLRQLAPSKDEVRLLSHVRQVNVDDRELAAGDSDGWFAVVAANRLPTPGLRHRACLVSLEQRSDVIFPAAPAPSQPLPPTGPKRLVLLYSWTFTAAPARPGGGTFRELAEALNAGLMGLGAAGVTAAGHRSLTLHDRTGADQAVAYRGALVARPVARDMLGPYHGADQARRVIPDAGADDISYSAAFELGRLLGAADGRLAQELMGWRREAYQAAARHSVADAVWADVPAIATPSATAVVTGMTAPVALTMVERAGSGAGQAADLTRALAVRAAPGLNARSLAAAWNLDPADAERLLTDPDPGTPATSPAVPDSAAPGSAAPGSAASNPAARNVETPSATPAADDELQAARRRLLGAPPMISPAEPPPTPQAEPPQTPPAPLAKEA